VTPLQQAEARLREHVAECESAGDVPLLESDVLLLLTELVRLRAAHAAAVAEIARLRVVDDAMVERALLAHRKEATRTRNSIMPIGIKFDDYQSWVRHDAMRAALEAAMGRG